MISPLLSPPPALEHAPALLVGYSGGLDSTVLLHLLAHWPGALPPLRALHVHHGLQPAADGWAAHCAQVCERWQVPLQVERVRVERDRGDGPEAAARDARRAAFARQLHAGEWLALAHHLDDQAETFVLRALRASGSRGLAAMRGQSAFGPGQLWRPLLQVPRAALLAYARQHGLHWIDDPSNASDDYDRNFLRLQVMPLLARRWPRAAAAFARSAALIADSEALLAEHDQADLAACVLADGSLAIAPLLPWSAPRRARVLRAWVQRCGLPPLPGKGVEAIEQQLLPARADLQPAFAWHGAQVVRWRQRLHGRWTAPAWPTDWQASWDGRQALPLPDGGHLQLHGAEAFEQPLQVRARRGGERIRLHGREHSSALKKLLQDSDLPPWQRQCLPLLCAGEEVLAAGDRIIAGRLQMWLDQRHARLHWQPAAGAN